MSDELVALSRGDERAKAIARQTRLVDDLIADAIDDGSLAVPDAVGPTPVVFHGHCHQNAAHALSSSVRLLNKLPGAQVDVLDAGCCGMAGSFGFERDHYDRSMQIGEMRLFPAIRAAPDDALIAATGVSCRQQIYHGTNRKAEHPVVLLHRALSG